MKITFEELGIKFQKIGWANDPEVAARDEVNYVVSECGDILATYGFKISEDSIETPNLEDCKKLEAILNELSIPMIDCLPNGIEKLTTEAKDYWKSWMEGHGDDTYYDYHNSFPNAIVTAVVKLMEERA